MRVDDIILVVGGKRVVNQSGKRLVGLNDRQRLDQRTEQCGSVYFLDSPIVRGRLASNASNAAMARSANCRHNVRRSAFLSRWRQSLCNSAAFRATVVGETASITAVNAAVKPGQPCRLQNAGKDASSCIAPSTVITCDREPADEVRIVQLLEQRQENGAVRCHRLLIPRIPLASRLPGADDGRGKVQACLPLFFTPSFRGSLELLHHACQAADGGLGAGVAQHGESVFHAARSRWPPDDTNAPVVIPALPV